jgi:hypothetical protein
MNINIPTLQMKTLKPQQVMRLTQGAQTCPSLLFGAAETKHQVVWPCHVRAGQQETPLG